MDPKFESSLVIILSYFDEIYGPQVMDIFPKGQYQNFQDIFQILSVLIDVSAVSNDGEWYFLYGDQNFASQNLRMSVLNPEARGGLSDILISLVLQPPHPQHIAAMSNDWKNIYSLQEIISDYITFENNIPQFDDGLINEIILSAHHEIVEQFQFFLDSISPGSHMIHRHNY